MSPRRQIIIRNPNINDYSGKSLAFRPRATYIISLNSENSHKYFDYYGLSRLHISSEYRRKRAN